MGYGPIKATVGPALEMLYQPWIRGEENIPAEGAAILASNHLAVIDSFFLPLLVDREVAFIGKADYFTGKGVKGWAVKNFMKTVGTIPVDRSGGKASQAALQAGIDRLRSGQLFGIYPEGTRSPDGRLYRGKTGVARIALATGAPVVPVAMIGSNLAQPIGKSIPSTRHRVGIVIGVVTMTGFGFSFVNLMGSLAQVHIGIFLLVLAGTCVIFGMGLPSLPAYILVATFGAPALVQAGVPVLAAHLFVMYFAISSGITPPVCLVAYAGAAIADAPPMKTGFTAFKLGIAAFIVPFIFIFEPALLLMGDWATILQAVFTAVLGVVCLASSMQGWLFTESSPAERVMMFVAGIVLVYPGLLTDLIGFGTASLVFFIQIARKKRLCAA